MSCAVFTFIGGYGAYFNKSNTWLVSMLFLSSYVLTIVAGFLAWRDKAREAQRLETKVRSLEELPATLLPVQNIYFPALPEPEKPHVFKHNVHFMGVEITDRAVTAIFKNMPVPGEEVGEFRNARLVVEYRFWDSGEEWLTIGAARWSAPNDSRASIEFVPQHAFLASFYEKSGWRALIPFTWDSRDDEESTPEERRDGIRLPNGKYRIRATLIGEHNTSLVPVEGMLILNDDGDATWKLTE